MRLNELPIVAQFDKEAGSALRTHPEPLEHLEYPCKDLRPSREQTRAWSGIKKISPCNRPYLPIGSWTVTFPLSHERKLLEIKAKRGQTGRSTEPQMKATV